MSKNPEVYRGTNQFPEVGGQITRRSDRHTLRGDAISLTGKVTTLKSVPDIEIDNKISPKERARVIGKAKSVKKQTMPKISEKQIVDANEVIVSVSDPMVEGEDHEEFKEQGEKVIYPDQDIDIKNSPFAKLPILLYDGKDDLEQDILAEDSTEVVAARELSRLPEEMEGFEDYAATAIDLRS